MHIQIKVTEGLSISHPVIQSSANRFVIPHDKGTMALFKPGQRFDLISSEMDSFKQGVILTVNDSAQGIVLES